MTMWVASMKNTAHSAVDTCGVLLWVFFVLFFVEQMTKRRKKQGTLAFKPATIQREKKYLLALLHRFKKIVYQMQMFSLLVLSSVLCHQALFLDVQSHIGSWNCASILRLDKLNSPPPFLQHKYGNLHTFPRPMICPATAKRNSILLDHCPLLWEMDAGWLWTICSLNLVSGPKWESIALQQQKIMDEGQLHSCKTCNSKNVYRKYKIYLWVNRYNKYVLIWRKCHCMFVVFL